MEHTKKLAFETGSLTADTWTKSYKNNSWQFKSILLDDDNDNGTFLE